LHELSVGALLQESLGIDDRLFWIAPWIISFLGCDRQAQQDSNSEHPKTHTFPPDLSQSKPHPAQDRYNMSRNCRNVARIN
jgi:hypothetical protein